MVRFTALQHQRQSTHQNVQALGDLINLIRRVLPDVQVKRVAEPIEFQLCLGSNPQVWNEFLIQAMVFLLYLI
jgi:hypothetical protein